MIPLSDKQLRVAGGILVALLLMSAAVDYINTRELHQDGYLVAHSNEVLRSLNRLLANMTDAETGERGYLITNDERYLTPYTDALAAADESVELVQELTADNKRQAARIPHLRELVRGKLDELAGTISLRKNHGFEAAQKEVMTHLGKNRMDAIRALIAEMQADEHELLRLRLQADNRAYKRSQAASALAGGLGIAGLLGFFWMTRRHLTARARTATAFYEQREWFRTTLASIGDAVIATDKEGRITFLNSVAQSLTGWDERQAVGRPLGEVFQIINEGTRSSVEDPAARALSEGRVVGLANHTILIRKDGTEVPIDDSAAPIKDEQGRVVGAVLVFRDITERKLTETEHRRASERIASVVDHVVDGIITIDEDGTVESFNPAAERIFGYRADEVIGRNVKLLMPAPYAQEHDGYIANFVHTGIARIIGIGREVTGCRKDGSTFPMDLAVSQFQADGGRRFTGIVRDITARKAAEQALQDADRRKDEFLATLAHELRNPLAPIRNALELLNRAGNDPAVFADTREMMERQLGHIVRLVDDLLDVSRITSGKMQLRKEQVDLAAVVNSAVEACRPNADDMGHQLTVSLPPQPLMLNADRTRLAQLFSNLLNNAVKYTPWGGHIWLTAERQGSQLSVSVRDTGIGISREHLPRVFEMFSQAAPALERSQGGLGIGLALAHGLVELHGGTIEARSDGIGKGSEFLVILPIDAAEQMTRLERKPREVTKRPSRECRILIVDDNRDSADSLQRLLRLEGHETQLAFDGLEAVQTAAAFRPQVVLLDIGLPKMNGYEVAKRIRQHDWGRSMVLIALTGWGQEEDKNRAFEAGFDHHLTKPVDPSALDRLLAMDSVCGPASPVESAH